MFFYRDGFFKMFFHTKGLAQQSKMYGEPNYFLLFRQTGRAKVNQIHDR